ncbi:MAG: hemerythrin domain-containing protein [Sandaracinaceae bacterium]
MSRDQPVQITHDDLDRVLDRVVELARGDKASVVLEAWRVFERDVRLHFASEEARLLPAYLREDAAQADEIEVEHDLMREDCRSFRQMLEQHGDLPLDDEARSKLEAVIALYRRHQEHEDEGVYAWAKAYFAKP